MVRKLPTQAPNSINDLEMFFDTKIFILTRTPIFDDKITIAKDFKTRTYKLKWLLCTEIPVLNICI